MPPAKRILALLLLLGCLARAESVSQGALTQEPVLASPAPLRVGVYPNAPKLFIDADGKASGILVELLHEIASAEHWALEFVACEWQACLEELEAGRIDLLPDMAWSEERARSYAFHQVPALHSWSQIYAQRGNKIRSLLDLKGRRIAVLAGSIQALTLPNVLAGYGAVLVPAASLERAFALVAAGQADAVAASHYFGDAAAGRHGLAATPVVFNPARLHYAAMPGRQQPALDAIDRHLASWRDDPNSVYFNTLRRWQAGSPAAPLPTSLLWVLAATVGLLLSALAVASWLRTEVAVRTRELRDNERKLATILDSVDRPHLHQGCAVALPVRQRRPVPPAQAPGGGHRRPDRRGPVRPRAGAAHARRRPGRDRGTPALRLRGAPVRQGLHHHQNPAHAWRGRHTAVRHHHRHHAPQAGRGIAAHRRDRVPVGRRHVRAQPGRGDDRGEPGLG